MLTTDPNLIRAAIAVERAASERANPPTFEETWARLKWTPFTRQMRAVEAHRDGVYATLFAGAAGPGKSTLARMLAIAFCRRHAGVRVGIFRRTYPELHRTHEIPITMLPTEWGVYRHDPREFHFNNGSILELGSCERDQDLSKYQSAEYQGLIFDEATQFTWLMIMFLNARVRSANPAHPKFMLLLTNPGGESHAQIKSTFVDAAEPETEFVARIGGGDGVPPAEFRAIFVPAKLTDNPALLENDPEYVTRLSALPSALRRAWMDGDWDQWEGQFFDEWRRDIHVIKPFEIPRSWPRWRALDFGHSNPFGCLWFARDEDRRIFVYREAYERRLTDREQARLVVELSREDPQVRYSLADPSVFSKQPNGTSIAQAWHNAGLRVIPANNDRKAGWMRVRQFLKNGETEKPALQVFSTCKNLIRTIPQMQYDRFKPEDMDTDKEDHLVDCLRYGTMGGSMRGGVVRLLDFQVESA